MKKAAIFVLTLAGLTALGVFIINSLTSSAGRRADAAFNAVEPDAAFRARYPAVGAKNASAARLEELADGLSLDLRPRVGTSNRRPAEVDAAVMQAMTAWLKTQHERPDDAIDPLPDPARKWMDAHAQQIEAIATHLDTADDPQWPLVQTGPRSEQPLPNLLGHMKLSRVLTVAALDAEAKGDHERAWRFEHAAWKLSRGLLRRPEIISQLISIAGVRMLAATTRKFETPVPAWFAEVAAIRPREEMYRAFRYEMSSARISSRDAALILGGGVDAASFGERVEAAVTAPYFQWAGNEVVGATSVEFDALRASDPCGVDAGAAMKRSLEKVSPLARHFGDMTMSNIANAFGRAANAEIAVEGTRKILEAKQAHRSAQVWPSTLPGIERSVCRDAQWEYSPGDAAAPILRFKGRVPQIDFAAATKIPTEYYVR